LKIKKLVAVTIPIYKTAIEGAELISLTQCIKVLGNYPIVFFAPKSLDTSFYENFCANKILFTVERFDDDYFENIAGYNRLMLTVDFYNRFKPFKYILIYQLDAFVFRDDLTYWCQQNYAYLAAPIVEICCKKQTDSGMKTLENYRKLLDLLNRLGFKRVGYKPIVNGGLSLRRVASFMGLLTMLHKKAELWKKYTYNEDGFFSYWFNVFFFIWRMPAVSEALKFSWELHPRECFALNYEKLPFGCHAFEKYDFDFWQPFMEGEGYTLKKTFYKNL